MPYLVPEVHVFTGSVSLIDSTAEKMNKCALRAEWMEGVKSHHGPRGTKPPTVAAAIAAAAALPHIAF
ncbi:hypothetical protein E2C01_095059 [Portunus trituberculatus]|uniref:Uncharacterized protein n=1 Tax=Portunus trituberculatus TaxID=210409 RepID=A0A5B7JU59_PORTR|nr:hypothetical protein [Portunus trituberculatus]